MSFLVADALLTGRVFRLAAGDWCKPFPLPEGCGLFEGSDVAEFARHHPDVIDVFSLPVRPPSDAMWIESVMPVDIHAVEGRPTVYDKCGMLLRCDESATDGSLWVLLDAYARVRSTGGPLRVDHAGAVHRLPFCGGFEIDERGMLVQPDGERSVSAVIVSDSEIDEFWPDPSTPVERSYGDAEVEAAMADLDENGRAELAAEYAKLVDARGQADRLAAEVVAQKVRAREMLEEWRPVFEVVASTALRVVAAANIRNTVREPLTASRQVRRARQRDGLVDPNEVTVLRVPGDQRRAAEIVAGFGSGAEKAHHAVLGHFAYYGDTHPDGEPRGLYFGKREGVFWRPPRWQGDPALGEVRHTYKVTPPSVANG